MNTTQKNRLSIPVTSSEKFLAKDESVKKTDLKDQKNPISIVSHSLFVDEILFSKMICLGRLSGVGGWAILSSQSYQSSRSTRDSKLINEETIMFQSACPFIKMIKIVNS